MAIVLTVCILFYVTNGASNTQNSPFYTRTVQAMQDKATAKSRADVIAEEAARQERVERVQKEHDAAVAAAAVVDETAAGKGSRAQKQQPIVQDAADASSSDKTVAGRKLMKGDKIVNERPTNDANDGVAKVGNVEAKASRVATKQAGDDDESDEEHRVETALNDILKKGPIIIFSKSYCPYSKKAKVCLLLHGTMFQYLLTYHQHILLDLYDISPPPYVVELDQHELGSGLQNKLEKTTGRRTVPNILINGKSIGGGDDVQELHDDGKIAEKITSMGGKRIQKVEPHLEKRSEVKFKA